MLISDTVFSKSSPGMEEPILKVKGGEGVHTHIGTHVSRRDTTQKLFLRYPDCCLPTKII